MALNWVLSGQLGFLLRKKAALIILVAKENIPVTILPPQLVYKKVGDTIHSSFIGGQIVRYFTESTFLMTPSRTTL